MSERAKLFNLILNSAVITAGVGRALVAAAATTPLSPEIVPVSASLVEI